MLLENKVAIVTGAGRGLGEAHAMALAAEGAVVIVNDPGVGADGTGADTTPAQRVASRINAAGGRATADYTDISSWSAAADLVTRAIADFGKIDILINNAGVCIPTAFGTLTEQDWHRQMDANAKGVAALIDAVARHWQTEQPQPGRSIVCTSSPGGAHPLPPLGVYGISKAAVLAIAQVAAQELSPLGVRVNALAPIARTRMVGAAMGGREINIEQIMPADPGYDFFLPEHAARLALYLVSPLCPFTGRLFGVRGDDIYLYDGWDAAYHTHNDGKAWTVEGLGAALALAPLQEQPRIIGPKGRLVSPFPSTALLAQLGIAAD